MNNNACLICKKELSEYEYHNLITTTTDQFCEERNEKDEPKATFVYNPSGKVITSEDDEKIKMIMKDAWVIKLREER